MNDRYPKVLVILAIVAVLAIIGVVLFSGKKEMTNPSSETPKTECVEGRTRTDAVGNIETCIGGKWVYTGNENDIKG